MFFFFPSKIQKLFWKIIKKKKVQQLRYPPEKEDLLENVIYL